MPVLVRTEVREDLKRENIPCSRLVVVAFLSFRRSNKMFWCLQGASCINSHHRTVLGTPSRLLPNLLLIFSSDVPRAFGNLQEASLEVVNPTLEAWNLGCLVGLEARLSMVPGVRRYRERGLLLGARGL